MLRAWYQKELEQDKRKGSATNTITVEEDDEIFGEDDDEAWGTYPATRNRSASPSTRSKPFDNSKSPRKQQAKQGPAKDKAPATQMPIGLCQTEPEVVITSKGFYDSD